MITECGNWVVRNGVIKHLHGDGKTGNIIMFQGKSLCDICNYTIPTSVKKLAKSQGEKMSTKKTGTEKKNQPRVKMPVGETSETEASAGTEQQAPPNREMEKLRVNLEGFEVTTVPYKEIKFAGKPNATVRDFLKSRDYRWDPHKGIWWGRSASMLGTPFDEPGIPLATETE